jgi:hypothetical protein
MTITGLDRQSTMTLGNLWPYARVYVASSLPRALAARCQGQQPSISVSSEKLEEGPKS